MWNEIKKVKWQNNLHFNELIKPLDSECTELQGTLWLDKNIKSEIKEFNAIDFNGVQTFTMQNYCYKTQSFSGERKSFPIKFKSVATTQSSLGERKRFFKWMQMLCDRTTKFLTQAQKFCDRTQRFSGEHKNFVTKRKVSLKSSKVLWLNAKFLKGAQRFCVCTPFLRKAQKYCNWMQIFQWLQKFCYQMQRFSRERKTFPSERKTFVTKHTVS